MSETKGFAKLFRFCDTIAEYEAAKTDGTVNDDVFVIIIQDKVAKFKGETFNLSGGSGEGGGVSEESIIEIELATAGTLVSIDKRINNQEKEINSKAATKDLQNSIKEILMEIINNELVIASSLSDLNNRINELQNQLRR